MLMRPGASASLVELTPAQRSGCWDALLGAMSYVSSLMCYVIHSLTFTKALYIPCQPIY